MPEVPVWFVQEAEQDVELVEDHVRLISEPTSVEELLDDSWTVGAGPDGSDEPPPPPPPQEAIINNETKKKEVL